VKIIKIKHVLKTELKRLSIIRYIKKIHARINNTNICLSQETDTFSIT